LSEPRLSLMSLVEWLVKDTLITQDDKIELLSLPKSANRDRQHPLTWVADQQYLNRKTGHPFTEEWLVGWLAERYQMPWVHIDPLKIKVGAVTQAMSFKFAQIHHILPVEVTPDHITVACADPGVVSWVKDIEHINRRSIHRVLAAPSDIARYTIEFFSLAQSIAGASEQHEQRSLSSIESILDLGSGKSLEADDEHIVRIVDWLFGYAFEQRASDIHIEPRRELCHLRFRIDGVLHKVYDLPAQVGAAITSRIKSLGRMNIAEKRRPQDSRLKTRGPEGDEVELRLSTMPTAFGEKLVMRIFDPDVLLRNFTELGFRKEERTRWHNMVNHNAGIVLVTGPTGSGKTTTLYSTLKMLATPEVNLCTIEDPIELIEPTFNQMQVQHNIDLNFASGIRALLRQDPDIIMVGEIRDMETAEMAIQAALTGHLVLSTLHTNDAPSAITRLLDVGVPSYLIRSALIGVMAQRLVRVLCPHCKAPTAIHADEWRNITLPWKVAPPQQIYEPVGCLQCRNTGFLGRAGLYEVMPLSEDMASLITDRMDVSKFRAQAMKEGMHTLRLAGAQKVAEGATTAAEVIRVTPSSIRAASG
jgi:general secretion pathway protein E